MLTLSRALAIGALVFTTWACSTTSDNGTTSGKDGGTGTGVDTGGTCTIPGKFCFTIVEGEDCAGQGGTVGTGTCPIGLGCCETATQTMCYYDLEDDIGGSIACTGTYIAGDAGSGDDDGGTVDASGDDTSGGPSAFVGSWSGSIATIDTCGSSSPTTASNAATLDIVLGSAADSLVVTTLNGCMWNYTVNGEGALAQAGQSCSVKGSDGGVTEVITVTQRELTLSNDQLTETGSVTLAKGSTSCSESEMGVLTE